MPPLQIKQTLHEYIDSADEKKLEAIYIILKDSIGEKYEYNEEALASIYSRRNSYKNEQAPVVTTEEFVRYVLQNKL